MRQIILLFSAFFFTITIRAQVGIGTETPESSSILELSSTTKGLLVPRMTEGQKNAISSPVQGLLVFQTNGTIGFYSYDGSNWLHLIHGSSQGLYFGPGTGNGDNNLAVGTSMGTGTGKRNTAIGSRALENYSGSGFDNNTAVGYYTLKKVTTGQQNTGLGAEVMFELTSGSQNTAIGAQTIINSTGSGNTALGYRAGETLTTGSNNILIGKNANVSSNNLSNATVIGANAIVDASNKIRLGDSNITNIETSGSITAGAITIPNTDGSANQILKTDGSGTLAWATPSAGISGSGTANMIPKFNGSSTTLGNSSIFDDGTNIGIGTTIPAGLLHLKAASGDAKAIISAYGEGDEAHLMLKTGGINKTAVVATGISNWGRTDLRFILNSYTNANSYGLSDTKMIIKNDGKVGIGTDSPAQKLDVTGSIKFSGALMPNNSSGSSGQVLTSSGSGAPTWTTPSAGISGSGTANRIPKFNGSSTVLGNSSIFDDGTNIGIGTTSPAGLLHLKAASGDAKAIISAYGEGDEAHLMLKTGGINKTAVVATGISNWGRTDLRFILNSYTNANSYGLSDTKMIIKNDGKVGIGTDSPAQKLDVTGSIKFSGALMPNNSSGSSGQVLTSSGSGAPTWTTISGGATNLDGLSDAINNNQFNTIIIGSTPNISQNAGYSTGLGRRVLESITTGDENIAMGHQALGETTTGSYNTAMGSHVIFRNTTGYQNSAYGQRALENNTTGYRNVGIGSSAGDTNITGYNNTLIGYNADLNSNNLTNATAIGANATVNASNKIKLGNSNIINVETSGTLTLGAITIPNTDGSANQVLKTNGSGTLSWTSPSSSSPSIQTPEDAYGVTLNDSDHGKIFSSQHSDYPVLPNPSNLSPGFTCTIVNYSNYDGTLTSPTTVSIIGARSNSKYQSKDHTGSVVSVHSNGKGGKQYPVSTIGFMSGGTVVVRVISKDNSNWYYVTGDFYYK
ncbi:hypothetical protein OAB54_03315 [Flavobacteriaceae bacterium]|nr:hypothetical protein [Flavobacteriaceae bacterium]